MESVEALLSTLVRIPSQNPMGRTACLGAPDYGESRITAYLEEWLQQRGIPCWRQPVSPGRDNLLALVPGRNSERTLLFDAHQDTVPAEGMSIDPFAAQVDQGRLYGRGACDVKGSLAAMLHAVARLASHPPERAASVFLACTVDEEYTHTGSSALADKTPFDRKIDLAIVAEPTSFRIVNCHKGAVRWRIHALGRACHSSTPQLGDNAIYRMARVVDALASLARRLAASTPDPVLGPPTLSIGRIQGGVSVNIVPDACCVEIDRRIIPGESPETARAQVATHLREHLDPADFAALRFDAPWVNMPALTPNVSNHLLHAVVDAVNYQLGSPVAEVGGVPFGTDAGPLGQAGIPCLVLGPGDIAQAHTQDEWIALDAVHAAATLYHDLAIRLA